MSAQQALHAAIERADPRALDIFDARSGARIDWPQLMRAVHDASVIVIGEQHDDALGHRVQLAIVQDAMAAECSARPPRRLVLSLEMLERDEQLLADDYLDGVIDAAALETLSHSQNWGGKGKWKTYYLPILEAAKDGGASILAANAPRRYVRLARTDGYERLRNLPPDRRALFDLPAQLDDEPYWQRFIEVMSEPHDEPAQAPSSSSDQSRVNEDHDDPLRAAFRSQRLWDATMAQSMAGARTSAGGDPPAIVHLVGQFHSDFDGGLVLELRHRIPGATILTISLQPIDQRDLPRPSLRDEDRGRADVVIYTFGTSHGPALGQGSS